MRGSDLERKEKRLRFYLSSFYLSSFFTLFYFILRMIRISLEAPLGQEKRTKKTLRVCGSRSVCLSVCLSVETGV
jgi:hypothetical protein